MDVKCSVNCRYHRAALFTSLALRFPMSHGVLLVDIRANFQLLLHSEDVESMSLDKGKGEKWAIEARKCKGYSHTV